MTPVANYELRPYARFDEKEQIWLPTVDIFKDGVFQKQETLPLGGGDKFLAQIYAELYAFGIQAENSPPYSKATDKVYKVVNA